MIGTWQMVNRCALGATALFLLLPVGGCSEDDPSPRPTPDAGGDGDGDATVMLPEGFGDAPDRNRVDTGNLCERLAVIQCIAERDCCSDPGRDLALCLEDQELVCKTGLQADQIAMDPVAGFDADAAEMVFMQLENLGRACDPGITAFSLSPSGFGGMFTGSVAVGGNCAPDNQVNRAMVGAALASCRNRDTHACLPTQSMWRCEPRGDGGAACFTDNNCLDGLYCDNFELSLDGGTCRARKADGETCSTFTECEGLSCVDNQCAGSDADSAYCFSS